MNIRALVLVLALISLTGAASAADTNISPANMSGAAPAAEAKSRPAPMSREERAAKREREPGFWDREAKRSGLAQTGEGWGNKVKSGFHIPKFFKDQEAAYKQRNSGTDN